MFSLPVSSGINSSRVWLLPWGQEREKSFTSHQDRSPENTLWGTVFNWWWLDTVTFPVRVEQFHISACSGWGHHCASTERKPVRIRVNICIVLTVVLGPDYVQYKCLLKNEFRISENIWQPNQKSLVLLQGCADLRKRQPSIKSSQENSFGSCVIAVLRLANMTKTGGQFVWDTPSPSVSRQSQSFRRKIIQISQDFCSKRVFILEPLGCPAPLNSVKF